MSSIWSSSGKSRGVEEKNLTQRHKNAEKNMPFLGDLGVSAVQTVLDSDELNGPARKAKK
jgi:hypothetical protein